MSWSKGTYSSSGPCVGGYQVSRDHLNLHRLPQIRCTVFVYGHSVARYLIIIITVHVRMRLHKQEMGITGPVSPACPEPTAYPPHPAILKDTCYTSSCHNPQPTELAKHGSSRADLAVRQSYRCTGP